MRWVRRIVLITSDARPKPRARRPRHSPSLHPGAEIQMAHSLHRVVGILRCDIKCTAAAPRLLLLFGAFLLPETQSWRRLVDAAAGGDESNLRGEPAGSGMSGIQTRRIDQLGLVCWVSLIMRECAHACACTHARTNAAASAHRAHTSAHVRGTTRPLTER